MPASEYTYVPLASDGSTFRIVTILPGGQDERIECSFLEVPTSSKPKYSALSYTWGDAALRGRVWIHGRVIPISENLKNALRRIRMSDRIIHCWIDALCINQEDEAGEKPTQIPLMRHIYQNSQLVTIYLGGEHDESDQIPSLLDCINHAYNRLDVTNNQSFTQNALRPDRYEELGLPHSKATIWQAFRHLLSRNWFTRIWVIQEAISATSAEIICGNWSIDWKRFLSIVFKAISLGLGVSPNRVQVASHSTLHGNPLLSVTQLVFFNVLKPADSKFIPWKLIDLLHYGRLSLASRRHDYCYGLLGLSKELSDPELKITYSLPVEAVYQYFASYFIAQGNGIQVLYNASGHSLNLPSWVPDWSHRNLPQPRIVPQPRNTNFENLAVAAASSFTPFIRLHSTDPNLLVVRGLVFDKIDDLGATYQPESIQTCRKTWKTIESPKKLKTTDIDVSKPDTNKDQEDTRTILLIAECIVELDQLLLNGQLKQYPGGDDRETVIWRTMICNYARNSTKKAPPSYVDLYRSLLWLIKAQNPAWEIPRSPYFDSISTQDIVKQDPVELLGNANIMIQQTRGLCSSKRRGRTERGYVGQFHIDTQVGDYVYIPLGSAVPYVIRPGSKSAYKLIGECYIHGIMEGEAFNVVEDGVIDLEFE